MYEEPILSGNVIDENIALEGTTIDANDNSSQEAVKSKKEEDLQYRLHSSKLILSWGLVFTFFR